MFGAVQVVQFSLLVGGMFTAGLLALAPKGGEGPPHREPETPEERASSCKAEHPLPPHFGEAAPVTEQPWRPEVPQLPWTKQAEKQA